MGVLSPIHAAVTGLFALSPVTPMELGDPRLPPTATLDRLETTQSVHLNLGHVAYINFDGAVLNGDAEDSRTNSTLLGFSGEFDPYGDGPKRAAVLQAVSADWTAYNMHITDRRPESGDYVMAMVGPTNFTGSLGVAFLDCMNQWTSNNIVFAFHHIDDRYSAAATATTISQEIAHTYGLEHVDDPADIMNPYNAGGDAAFLDDCTPLVPANFGIACREQHETYCGPTNQQNGHAELLELLGPRGATPPPVELSLMSPRDGQVFADNEEVRIEVALPEDWEGELVLLRDEQVLSTDDTAPWGWIIPQLRAGLHVFEVEAWDRDGGQTAAILVEVEVKTSASSPAHPDDTPADAGLEDEGDDSTGHAPVQAFDDVACSLAPKGGRRPGTVGWLLLTVAFARRARMQPRRVPGSPRPGHGPLEPVRLRPSDARPAPIFSPTLHREPR